MPDKNEGEKPDISQSCSSNVLGIGRHFIQMYFQIKKQKTQILFLNAITQAGFNFNVLLSEPVYNTTV